MNRRRLLKLGASYFTIASFGVTVVAARPANAGEFSDIGSSLGGALGSLFGGSSDAEFEIIEAYLQQITANQELILKAVTTISQQLKLLAEYATLIPSMTVELAANTAARGLYRRVVDTEISTLKKALGSDAQFGDFDKNVLDGHIEQIRIVSSNHVEVVSSVGQSLQAVASLRLIYLSAKSLLNQMALLGLDTESRVTQIKLSLSDVKIGVEKFLFDDFTAPSSSFLKVETQLRVDRELALETVFQTIRNTHSRELFARQVEIEPRFSIPFIFTVVDGFDKSSCVFPDGTIIRQSGPVHNLLASRALLRPDMDRYFWVYGDNECSPEPITSNHTGYLWGQVDRTTLSAQEAGLVLLNPVPLNEVNAQIRRQVEPTNAAILAYNDATSLYFPYVVARQLMTELHADTEASLSEVQ